MPDYPKPSVTVDIIGLHKLGIILIERGGEPYKGSLAIPGGFVEPGETVEEAAQREYIEECALGIELHRFKLCPIASKPGRDPRGWVISIPFKVHLTSEEFSSARAGDDAAKIVRYDTMARDPRNDFAFDHRDVLTRALTYN